ncbi:hypothetical protein DXG01_013862 [Tephrocybe rancida]|nr:hypothetical protein DXG01_013862 [Tephrocybe rancida]
MPLAPPGPVDEPIPGILATTEERKEPERAILDKDFRFIPIPRRLRYDPDAPFHFGLLMNASFGFGGTFRTSLLIQNDSIPTLTQAGYAAGLLFISPLGDLVRRRQLLLGLIFLATTLSVGLAVTSSLVVFEVLSFFVGMASVVPQILLPLAADLAPPKRRASAISVVLSGILFGILAARVLAGVIAEFTTWRVVYYVAIGTQAFVLVGGYLILPDYPSKNDHLTYWDILYTMAKYAVTEPLLIQVCIINLFNSACFSNLWVTLTFLLGGPPYNYSTLVIGLFGLVGMLGVALVPLLGRWVDKLLPWHSLLINIILLICFQAIQTGAGGIHISAIVIAILGIDLFRQTTQVSISMATYSISDEARSRLNAVMVLSFFIGQVVGTSVGTKVFVEKGWRAGSGLSMGWYGLQLLVLFVRGPHCRRFTWFGYEGGLEGRKSVLERRAAERDVETTSTWSSIPSRSIELLPSTYAPQSQTLLDVLLSNDDVCELDAVVLVGQEGLRATDLQALSPSSRFVRLLYDYTAQRQYHYVKPQQGADLSDAAEAVAARCGFNTIYLTPGAIPGHFSHDTKNVVSATLPSLDGQTGGSRKDRVSLYTSQLADELEYISSTYPKHLVIYTGTPSATRQEPDSDALTRPVFDYLFAPVNSTLAEGGILKRYQLLTPGLITVLLIAFFILVPILLFGFGALASIQSPLQTEAGSKFNADDKKKQ